MKLRVARHTDRLQPIIDFYQHIIGLTVTGSFRDHNTYDGVFLGLPGLAWHLEFTTSPEPARHEPDDDDLLVFYVNSKAEQEVIKQKCIDNQVRFMTARNPYWNENGLTIADPDGYRVVITVAQSNI
jgi:hypothetical protein